MNKEKTKLLIASIFAFVYLVAQFLLQMFTNSLVSENIYINIYNISMYVLSTLGSILFLCLSLTKKDISKFRGSIIFFSIILLLLNIVSGILGFIVSHKINKSKKRELPKLEILYNYKWYIYLIVLIICLGVIFGLSLILKDIYIRILYVAILLLLLFIFRKDVKRDIKYFIKYFKEYNLLVFKYYGISLLFLLIISISIKFTTGIDNATNQVNLSSLFTKTPIYVMILSMIYAPITEELMFRGIFRKFIKNKWLFIFISGLLFGAAHVLDDFQSIGELLYIFVYGSLGCFLAYVYTKTNNIFTNIYFHFIQNTLAIVALLLTSFLL